ncbi:MAG: threonylcarbamoyl-AMP synthase [Pseudopedobacter saltans]|uniref:L-threonylcarbamoyladenylate synthase n=1 Tax=Pseudopedobacter saltans TaxID=151895 RepID=A0A2W5F6U1_9SPHI|nr:MAG: threonylcarbamoyl-AMP synthase [Pseudopedobacter saltans]
MNEDFTADLDACLDVLKKGGIILYPTDTVWGLGCDATNAEAVEKIINLKHRPANKSFVTLLADERDLIQYVAAPDLSVFDYLEKQDRPTTIIYDHALVLADNVVSENGSVAIRICKDEFCKKIIKRLHKPIVSTSANISGEPAPAIFSEINSLIVDGVDHAVQYRRTDESRSKPSKIIKWENGEVTVIRE